MIDVLCACVGVKRICRVLRAISVRVRMKNYFNFLEDASSHRCNSHCFDRVNGTDPDIYICRLSGFIHHCGDNVCAATVQSGEGEVCTYTARCFGVRIIDHHELSAEGLANARNAIADRKRAIDENNNCIADRVLEFLRDGLVECSDETCICKRRMQLPFQDIPALALAKLVIFCTWATVCRHRKNPLNTDVKTYKFVYHAFVTAYEMREGLRKDTHVLIPKDSFLQSHLPEPGKYITKYTILQPKKNKLEICWYTATRKSFKSIMARMTNPETIDMANNMHSATRKCRQL